MRVLGVDPSTKTGLAIVEDSGRVGTVVATLEVQFKKLVGLERASAIAGEVLAFRNQHKPDIAVIEEMFIGHTSSAIPIIQIGTILRYFLWQDGFPYYDCPATTLKKWVCGKGNVKKDQMMLHVFKRWGFESPSDNICDAVALGYFGLSKYIKNP
jgi:crossover junction endodeoxyribonuclease RuvC